ncbi:MAG: hypothetical protein AAGA25_00505 [Planctomycetota bacterium]
MKMVCALLLIFSVFAIGCDRKPELTPAQEHIASAIRQASISSSEKLLGRSLTDREKACVVIEFDNGFPTAHIEAPLSQTLLDRKDELAQQNKTKD